MRAHFSCCGFISAHFYSVHKVLSSEQQGIETQTSTCACNPVLSHVSHKHTQIYDHCKSPARLIAVTADIARQRRVISSAVVYEWMLIRPPPTPLMSFSSLPREKRPEKALSFHLFCSLPWDSLSVTYIRFHSTTGEITRKIQTKRRYVKDEDIPEMRKRQNKKLVRAKMSADQLAVDWIKVLLQERITLQCCSNPHPLPPPPPAPPNRKCIVTRIHDISRYIMKNQTA